MHLSESFNRPNGQVPDIFLMRLIFRERALPLALGGPPVLALLETFSEVLQREAAWRLHLEAVPTTWQEKGAWLLLGYERWSVTSTRHV